LLHCNKEVINVCGALIHIMSALDNKNSMLLNFETSIQTGSLAA